MSQETNIFEPVETFQFHGPFAEETNNGLYFNKFHLPEEVVGMILSYINPEHLLKATLVCKKWCNIIKSTQFWTGLYTRKYNKKPKKLPWYVYYCLMSTNYFDTNLIKNGNGEEKFKHWTIVFNSGGGFEIRDCYDGVNHQPPDVPEFRGKTSCFSTSCSRCNKQQEISFENNRLMQLILDRFRPHIYLSEWVVRNACGHCVCIYTLCCKLYGERRMVISADLGENGTIDELVFVSKTEKLFEPKSGSAWSKVELIVKNYPRKVKKIVFEHEGIPVQLRRSYCGNKMAGGVLKILFDSIESCS